MKEQVKNVLTAAGDYLDDHQYEIFLRSLFGGDKVMVTALRLRWLYKALKSKYQAAAQKNALEQSKSSDK